MIFAVTKMSAINLDDAAREERGKQVLGGIQYVLLSEGRGSKWNCSCCCVMIFLTR